VRLAAWLADSRPLGAPIESSRSLSGAVPELVLAAILVVVGLLSLRKWLRAHFEASSMREQVLYSLHVTSRVGTWFALAGFFIGYAIVDEPQSFGWYVYVLIGLASIQLLTGFSLWRSSDPPDRREGGSIE
jgi:hypothetical protein